MKRLIMIMLSFLLFAQFLQASTAEWNQVKWVVDGDTVVLVDGQKVRYIGINAPEVAHNDQTAEPYGEAAKRFNTLLVNRKKVRLELDKERFDRFHRLLAYVFLENGTFVNAEIISNGYAYLLKKRPNLKYDSILLQSQRSAMSDRKGIWQNWKENKNTVIGNKNSHRFHLPTCPFGKQIKPQNRVVYRKKWDAFWDGYAPAKRCMPVFEIPGN